jgi:hypothetical protein
VASLGILFHRMGVLIAESERVVRFWVVGLFSVYGSPEFTAAVVCKSDDGPDRGFSK